LFIYSTTWYGSAIGIGLLMHKNIIN
jgi:hypothetical protein